MPHPSELQPQLFPREEIITQPEHTEQVHREAVTTETPAPVPDQKHRSLIDILRNNKPAALGALGGVVVTAALFNLQRGDQSPIEIPASNNAAEDIDDTSSSQATTPEPVPPIQSGQPELGAEQDIPTISEFTPRDRYVSPITNESMPRETWLNLWLTQSERVAGPEPGTDATRNYISNTINDLRERIGLDPSEAAGKMVQYADNIGYLYEVNDRLFAVEKPIVYGMRFVTDDSGNPAGRWSWEASKSEYPNYSIMFPLDGEVVQFTTTDDGDMRWFSQANARIVGIFYLDEATAGHISSTSIHNAAALMDYDEERRQTQFAHGVAEVTEHESDWDAWDMLEQKYPDLSPVELTEINRFHSNP